jgi:hypothetical protein
VLDQCSRIDRQVFAVVYVLWNTTIQIPIAHGASVLYAAPALGSPFTDPLVILVGPCGECKSCGRSCTVEFVEGRWAKVDKNIIERPARCDYIVSTALQDSTPLIECRLRLDAIVAWDPHKARS